MPVDFLTDEQAQRYGRYTGEPSPAQLARFFHLDDTDHALVTQRRGEHNRLGMALQLCTVRFLGTFLDDPTDVPPGVVTCLCRQLSIPNPACLPRYLVRPSTHYDHAQAIKQRYGYHDFHTPSVIWGLLRWLYSRAWLTTERPSVLFDLATARLVEQKVLLPGVTVLARLVAQVRERVALRVWRRLATLPSAAQRHRLQGLLEVPEGTRSTPLERLRRAPTRVSGPGLVQALQRVEDFRALGVSDLLLDQVPPARLKALARYAAAARAQAIARMPDDRRIATLLAFAHTFEVVALDDALDLFDLMMNDLIREATSTGEETRVRTLRDLDAAALQLRTACQVLLDARIADTGLRRVIFARVPLAALVTASKTVETLTRPADDQYYPELIERYQSVRRFFPAFLHTVQLQGTPAGRPLFAALDFLSASFTQRHPPMQHAPVDMLPRAWRRVILNDAKQVGRHAYTVCVAERLHESLRRRDIFVPKSERWGDPRVKLLPGAQWESLRPQVCRALGHPDHAAPALHALTQQLDAAYHRTLANWPTNSAVRVERRRDRDTLVLTGLEKLEEPRSLITLREQLQTRLPRVDLPEVLLEIHARTGFAQEFTHISTGEARVADLPVSLCAVLLAEACNIGLEPVIRPDVPALTRGRLSWIQQNYIRAETLSRANARLVDTQTTLPLAHAWGGGEVASADGLRFVVPVRTLNAGPNRKYYNASRGVTYYNFTSDQFTGFHGIVIPGTLRDSMFILDGLLEQQTSLRPLEIMTDTAGTSDIVFGLFWLLGYQFSPRLADIGAARFWRLDPRADYGVLNEIARHRIPTALITRHWDDLLRVAGSLHQGTVSASELCRSLLHSKRPSSLARALGALGRISKTLYLLAYIDDESYRRRILTQLNRGEARHSVARAVFHGQRGELRQRYREGQEDQLGALGLVLNVIVLWNTLYMDAALHQLRAEEFPVHLSDVARLSPLVHRHINFQGRYAFALADSIVQGALRPLRTPHEVSEEEEWSPA